jgi:predicted hotdog family 3-hydroxylacyl-ACP dehydratase
MKHPHVHRGPSQDGLFPSTRRLSAHCPQLASAYVLTPIIKKSLTSDETTGNFEALSRPRVENNSESGGAESETDPANEPLSGIGAS